VQYSHYQPPYIPLAPRTILATPVLRIHGTMGNEKQTI